MENDQLARARRGRLIFLAAMLILSAALLSEPAPPPSSRTSRRSGSMPTPHPPSLPAEHRNLVVEALQASGSEWVFPSNVSHNFRGAWRQVSPEDAVPPKAPNISTEVHWAPFLPSRPYFTKTEGSMLIQVLSVGTSVPGVQLVTGSFHIADGDTATHYDLRGPLQGIFLENLGTLTLVSNRAGADISIRLTDDTASAPPVRPHSKVPPASQPSSPGSQTRTGDDDIDPDAVVMPGDSQSSQTASKAPDSGSGSYGGPGSYGSSSYPEDGPAGSQSGSAGSDPNANGDDIQTPYGTPSHTVETSHGSGVGPSEDDDPSVSSSLPSGFGVRRRRLTGRRSTDSTVGVDARLRPNAPRAQPPFTAPSHAEPVPSRPASLPGDNGADVPLGPQFDPLAYTLKTGPMAGSATAPETVPLRLDPTAIKPPALDAAPELEDSLTNEHPATKLEALGGFVTGSSRGGASLVPEDTPGVAAPAKSSAGIGMGGAGSNSRKARRAASASASTTGGTTGGTRPPYSSLMSDRCSLRADLQVAPVAHRQIARWHAPSATEGTGSGSGSGAGSGSLSSGGDVDTDSRRLSRRAPVREPNFVSTALGLLFGHGFNLGVSLGRGIGQLGSEAVTEDVPEQNPHPSRMLVSDYDLPRTEAHTRNLAEQLGHGILSVMSDQDTADTGTGISGPLMLPMVGVISSPNCGFVINVTLTALVIDQERAESKASQYALLLTFCIVLQMMALVGQITTASTPASISRISLLSVGMQAVADSYICLLHLVAGIVWEALFNSFATISFTKLMLFSILEMRLMLVIWKSRRADAFANGWNEMRRQLGILYARFYGALILGLFLLYQFWSVLPVFLFIGYSFWVPQILHSAHRDTPDGLSNFYVITMSCTRLVLPLYFFGCPYNFIQFFHPSAPNYGILLMLIGWMAFQVLVMRMQRTWGPRFFIPARFLPDKYDYYRPILVRNNRVQNDPNGSWRRSTDNAGLGGPSRWSRFRTWVYRKLVDIFRRGRRRSPGAYAPVRTDPNTREDAYGGDVESGLRGSVPGGLGLSGRNQDGANSVIRRDVPGSGSSPRGPVGVGAAGGVGVVGGGAGGGGVSGGGGGAGDVGGGGGSSGTRVVLDGPDAAGGASVAAHSNAGEGEGEGEGEGDNGSVDCVICMVEVQVADRDYMVTPCNHLFHEECLQRWMDVKMECPTCRTQLPAP